MHSTAAPDHPSALPVAASAAGTASGAIPAKGQLKAALWDMDGTLVDTEPYWIQAEKDLVKAHGGTWTDEHAMTLVGQALGTSAGILQEAGVDLSVREIIDFLSGQVMDRVRQDVPWRPGARELLHDLWQNDVRCALVTMSEGPMAREIVDALDHPYFEFLITGDMVANGKPHPEPYLAAVERLQATDPDLGISNCVALEDSVPGVASAMASGVATIAIPHAVPMAPAAGRATWTTLAGRGALDLRLVVAQHADGGLA